MKYSKWLMIAAALMVSIGIIACGGSEAEDTLSAQRNAVIDIHINGQSAATADFATIEDLPYHEFEATLRTSGGMERIHTYGGVEVRDLLTALDIDSSGAEQLMAQASDGYAVALDIDEVMQPDNVYVIYMMDGEGMADEEQGGPGPYQLLIRSDSFGQRWTKFLVLLDLR